MTDNYAKYAKRQNPPAGTPGVAPLSADEKAELKMRIMLAINCNMALKRACVCHGNKGIANSFRQ